MSKPTSTGGSSGGWRGFGLAVACLAIAVGAAGCAVGSWQADYASADPGSRTAAVEATMRRYRPDLDAAFVPPFGDPQFQSDLRWLVVMLQSDDPAVRFVAIEALASLVGERHGYAAANPLPERAVAVQRWTDWLYARGLATSSVLPPTGLLPPPSEPTSNADANST